MTTPNHVIVMLTDTLRARNMDGLFNADRQCGCRLPLLSPYACLRTDCEAGRLEPCECGEHDYHIAEVPEVAAEAAPAGAPSATENGGQS